MGRVAVGSRTGCLIPRKPSISFARARETIKSPGARTMITPGSAAYATFTSFDHLRVANGKITSIR